MASGYRLKALYELRQAEVEGRAKILVSARQEVERAERLLRAERESLEAARAEQTSRAEEEWRRALEGGVRPGELIAQAQWRDSTAKQLATHAERVSGHEARVRDVEQQAAAAQAALLASRQQAQALEKHRERWALDQQREREAKEADELDEQGARCQGLPWKLR